MPTYVQGNLFCTNPIKILMLYYTSTKSYSNVPTHLIATTLHLMGFVQSVLGLNEALDQGCPRGALS